MDIVDGFLEAAGVLADPAAAAAAVRALYEEARTAYPSVRIDERLLGRYFAERIDRSDRPDAGLPGLHGGELLVACACAQGDATAIAVFEQTFLAPSIRALVRMGESAADVDEAAQILRERLFVTGHRITEFSGRGALGGWVRVSLARQLTSLQRSRGKIAPPPVNAADELADVDPELALVRRRYGDVFRSAFHDAFGGLTPEQRSVLRLHFVDGVILERLAPILGVSRATAGRRVLEAKHALLENMLTLLGERLQASASEIRSLLAVVRSTLYSSLGSLLRE